MSITVQSFADELKRPVTELLSQLNEAGVSAKDAASTVSPADKQALLTYLQQKTKLTVGAGGASRITLKRKESSEIKLSGARGAPTKTISVEVRKKRTFVKPDSAEFAAETEEARKAAEEAAAKAEAAREAAEGQSSAHAKAEAFRDKVFTAQSALREDVDALEQILPKDLWPVPSYADMLFGF